MVKEQPKEMADFLRTAREKGVTAAELTEMTRKLRSRGK
jgi:anthranilate phosphoribosyltransferase